MGRSCPAHDTPQFDCIDCRRIATLRQAAEDGHVELASTVLVDTLEPYVELVLNALHHPEALVTYQSTIGDFGLDDDELSTASARLEETLSDMDYIYEVAHAFETSRRISETIRKLFVSLLLWHCFDALTSGLGLGRVGRPVKDLQLLAAELPRQSGLLTFGSNSPRHLLIQAVSVRQAQVTEPPQFATEAWCNSGVMRRQSRAAIACGW